MVQWADSHMNKKLKKVKRYYSADTAHRYKCLLDRYQSIDFTLKQFEKGLVEMPDPRRLIQEVTDRKTGRKEPTMICQSTYFTHLKAIVREQIIKNEDTGEYRMQWKQLGIDPHFVHATNYCFFALEKIRNSFNFTFL